MVVCMSWGCSERVHSCYSSSLWCPQRFSCIRPLRPKHFQKERLGTTTTSTTSSLSHLPCLFEPVNRSVRQPCHDFKGSVEVVQFVAFLQTIGITLVLISKYKEEGKKTYISYSKELLQLLYAFCKFWGHHYFNGNPITDLYYLEERLNQDIGRGGGRRLVTLLKFWLIIKIFGDLMALSFLLQAWPKNSLASIQRYTSDSIRVICCAHSPVSTSLKWIPNFTVGNTGEVVDASWYSLCKGVPDIFLLLWRCQI